MTKFSTKSNPPPAKTNSKKSNFKPPKPVADEFADILSAIGKLNESERGETTSTSKLSKQERRNLNKKNRINNALTIQQTSSDKVVPTESVYKRETVYPPGLTDFEGPWDRFLTPEDKEYQSVVDQCYKGLQVCSPDKFDAKFRADFDAALEGLDVEGFYQYDVTQPQGLGSKTAKTFVTRCLLGDAGTTYKYLGIRMFSVPWAAGPNGDTSLTSAHAIAIGRLNKRLIEHSAKLLKKEGKEKVGSCQYNLTLVNRYDERSDDLSLISLSFESLTGSALLFLVPHLIP